MCICFCCCYTIHVDFEPYCKVYNTKHIGGVDFDDGDLTYTCSISETRVNNTAVSVLRIYDTNYFNNNVTVFTCSGQNGIVNYIGSPENDSVELILSCEW